MALVKGIEVSVNCGVMGVKNGKVVRVHSDGKVTIKLDGVEGNVAVNHDQVRTLGEQSQEQKRKRRNSSGQSQEQSQHLANSRRNSRRNSSDVRDRYSTNKRGEQTVMNLMSSMGAPKEAMQGFLHHETSDQARKQQRELSCQKGFQGLATQKIANTHDFNPTGASDHTALHKAIQDGSNKLALTQLRFKEIDELENFLHYACRWGNKEVVECIVDTLWKSGIRLADLASVKEVDPLGTVRIYGRNEEGWKKDKHGCYPWRVLDNYLRKKYLFQAEQGDRVMMREDCGKLRAGARGQIFEVFRRNGETRKITAIFEKDGDEPWTIEGNELGCVKLMMVTSPAPKRRPIDKRDASMTVRCMYEGKTFLTYASPRWSIDAWRSIVAQERRIPEQDKHGNYLQVWNCEDGKRLNASKNFSWYDLRSNCTLKLTRPNDISLYGGSSFQICLKTLTGRTTMMDVSHNDTVGAVKARIEQHHKIPAHQQRLIHGGRQLQDDNTMGDYGIERESEVRMALRLRGGASQPAMCGTTGTYSENGVVASTSVTATSDTGTHHWRSGGSNGRLGGSGGSLVLDLAISGQVKKGDDRGFADERIDLINSKRSSKYSGKTFFFKGSSTSKARLVFLDDEGDAVKNLWPYLESWSGKDLYGLSSIWVNFRQSGTFTVESDARCIKDPENGYHGCGKKASPVKIYSSNGKCQEQIFNKCCGSPYICVNSLEICYEAS